MSRATDICPECGGERRLKDGVAYCAEPRTPNGQDDEWTAAMASDALDTVRNEMGHVFVNWHDKRVEQELLTARRYLDRARAIVRGLDPDTWT